MSKDKLIKKFLCASLHFLIISLLTILTQVGGLVYLLSLLIKRQLQYKKRFHLIIIFLVMYSTTTFLIVPQIAPIFGRERIKENNNLQPCNFSYKLLNRNYVNPELNDLLISISKHYNQNMPEIKIVYLDANFPFLNDFPLLPHLSHNDGKKIDLSFIYYDVDGHITNKKPSRSGYGIFVDESKNNKTKSRICKQQEHWQYNFSKYFTFGKIDRNLKLAEEQSTHLIKLILKRDKVEKIFMEPYLKKQLNLHHPKIRFHGCHSVRHDDHVHIQIK